MMKYLLIFLGLFYLASTAFASNGDSGTATSDTRNPNGGFFVNLNVTLGLLGAGVFFPTDDERDTLFVPSVGPMLRMAYPLFVSDEVVGGRRDVYFDTGIILYATYGIIEETHSAFIGGVGPSFGFYNGVITVSACASYAYDLIEGAKSGSNSGFFWTLIFTSDSLNL